MSPRKNRRRHRRLRIQPLEFRRLLHGEGMLSGTVFFDADGDGARGVAEAGVPGVVLQLTVTDASVSQSTITDDNGNYTFDELVPGTYTVAKRQMQAISGGASNDAVLAGLVLEDDQELGGLQFGEPSLRPEFVTVAWFFASSPPGNQLLREAIALGEELAGDANLAASIRASGGNGSFEFNNFPIAGDDSFSVNQNDVLVVDAQSGVLVNDVDSDGESLTATLVAQAQNGVVSLADDGSFTYTPNTDFSSTDSFTYQANDGRDDSNTATVTIIVNPSDDGNRTPVATNDSFVAQENQSLVINADSGVLANDTDANGDSLTATIVDQPDNGSVSLNPDGSFTYQGDNEFFGDDSFTYRASDGTATSNLGTVSIDVRPVDAGTPFASVTTGSFTDSGVRGDRTDLVAGAPAITATHVPGDIDYTGYSNPPTYGPHHGFDPQGVDSNPGITPRPTGIYTEEQPVEDLLHNLEHGHVWISYNPSLLSQSDVAALEQLVRDGTGDANGGGLGVILTPRAANDDAIAIASWARLLTLDNYDPDTIRDFVNTNRGKSPEGFITP